MQWKLTLGRNLLEFIKSQLLVMIRLTINNLCWQICLPNSTTVLYQLLQTTNENKWRTTLQSILLSFSSFNPSVPSFVLSLSLVLSIKYLAFSSRRSLASFSKFSTLFSSSFSLSEVEGFSERLSIWWYSPLCCDGFCESNKCDM